MDKVNKMNEQLFREIMNSPKEDWTHNTCPVYAGLKIINSYLPGFGVMGCSNDRILSVSISELIKAGIDELDVIELRDLGWSISNTNRLQIYV